MTNKPRNKSGIEQALLAYHDLKMLGLNLYTLIIGYKSYNMLSILNELTVQKTLQSFVTKNVFLVKHTVI